MLKNASELIGFIQEEKEEFEKLSETVDRINSSQYVSRDTLVPVKQKVLKSMVAQVSKQHKPKPGGPHNNLTETLSSVDASRYLGASHSTPFFVPQPPLGQSLFQMPKYHLVPSQSQNLGFHSQNKVQSVRHSVAEELDDHECNVIDDEEEALDAIKARQADAASKAREN